MNGISLNGINNIFQNPLMQNPITGNKGILPNQSENVKNDMIPKGTVSGVEKLEDEQKSGFAVQMNADKDTFEFSGQLPKAKEGFDKPLAETSEKERLDMAVQYFEEYTDISDKWMNGEISTDEHTEWMKDLNERYGTAGASIFVNLDGEEIASYVSFQADESLESLDSETQFNLQTVNVTGEVKVGEKFSPQLVNSLMEDYMFQKSQESAEQRQEILDKMQEEWEEAKKTPFEAFA